MAARRGKKRPPVMVKVLRALRRDYRERMAKAALDVSRGSEFLKGVREHAHAKKPRRTPKGIAIRKYYGAVQMREPKPGERYILHTHPSYGRLSIQDMLMFVENFRKKGVWSESVHIVDSGRADRHLFRSMAPVRARLMDTKRRPTEAHQEAAKKAVHEAAKLIDIAGRVVIRPAQNLRKMPPERLKSLLDYLREQAKLEAEYGTFTLDPRALNKSSEQHYAEVLDHLEKNYGELFRMRHTPNKGYTYDASSEAFIKEDASPS